MVLVIELKAPVRSANRLVKASGVAGVVSIRAARRTVLTRTGDVDDQGAAVPFRAIQGENGGIAFRRVHGHEGEPTSASGDSVHDDVDLIHGPMFGQLVAEIRFGDVKGKIPDVQVWGHKLSLV